jgi:hypothetical protein
VEKAQTVKTDMRQKPGAFRDCAHRVAALLTPHAAAQSYNKVHRSRHAGL